MLENENISFCFADESSILETRTRTARLSSFQTFQSSGHLADLDTIQCSLIVCLQICNAIDHRTSFSMPCSRYCGVIST